LSFGSGGLRAIGGEHPAWAKFPAGTSSIRIVTMSGSMCHVLETVSVIRRTSSRASLNGSTGDGLDDDARHRLLLRVAPSRCRDVDFQKPFPQRLVVVADPYSI
jgi:hypothetical protein